MLQPELLSGTLEADALLGLPHYHHSHPHPCFLQGLRLLPDLRLQAMFVSKVFANVFFSLKFLMSMTLNRGRILSEFFEVLFSNYILPQDPEKFSLGKMPESMGRELGQDYSQCKS